MALMNLLNIGKSAIFASQAAINVASHNIANVNTPGYTRQEAILRIASPIVRVPGGYLGMGVAVSSIERRYDRFISGQLLGQEQNYGRSSVMDQVLGQVEQVFNDAGGAGLSDSINAFFDSWRTLSATPEDTAKRTVLISDANTLVDTMKQMERNLLGTIKETNGEIADVADRVNGIATDIARLNAQIVQIESGGGSANANDLRDARDGLVTELSGLAEIGTLEDKNGSLTVTLGMRNLVDRETVNRVTTSNDAAGDVRLSLDGVDVTSRIVNGRLGGLFASRDAVESGPLVGLRRLAAALTDEMNQLHRAGVGLDGTTGNDFFTPLSPPLTEADAISNLDVAVSDPRKIAAASAASALPGDNTNALRIAGLAEASVASLGNATFSGYYGGIVADVGKSARDASDLQQFDGNLRSELQNRRESASGVSLDEEATNLIAFQRAYEAGAKIIRITDELLQAVLKL
ncbi:MAG: flagellar hook-associated protein FlgK [Deltaproteobacteria bacterium CG2_30_66_27]|nr:MAG: flagellar hook-associated protein FlgK [Deltaproteobacteria bacterium CG2_30_66_27]